MKFVIVTASIRLEGLQDAIQSVDNQTYKNWEHIIINDGSEEIRANMPFVALGSQFPDKRNWIDIGFRTGNFGGIARNIGAMVAFSYYKHRSDDEWVVFLDDDNLWQPNHLETIVEAHRINPQATLIGVDMEIRGVKDPNYKHILPCAIKPQQCDLGSFAYKRELFDKYGYFKPRAERRISYDYELISKIAEGEGVDRVQIIHENTFIFYHKQR